MIPDVGIGLAQLLGNLCERVVLKKVQPERFSLVLGQVFYDPFPPIPAEKPFDGMVVVCSQIAGLFTFNRSVHNPGQIESLGL